jgi:predicted Ser/Thr protein kinase
MTGPGTAIGDFRLEELVGRGGMGVVYRATQVSLGRTVAIKLIAEAVADDPAFRARFKREARLAAGLDHPNVIPIYQADEAAGRLFIAMRYVEGTDLGALVAEQGPLPAEEAAAIAGQVAAALDAAHAHGLVHRDVKPGNVLVDRAGHVYLTDFGITKQVASRTGLTLEGGLVGTLDYAAPEQLRGGPVDARTDVYALGCLLFELLTGEVPYRRASEGEKVLAHLSAPPPLPSESRSDLPAGFDAVVARAMAKEPDARYASAGELASAAQAALAGERLTRPAAPVVAAPEPAAAPHDDARRGRPVALLGICRRDRRRRVRGRSAVRRARGSRRRLSAGGRGRVRGGQPCPGGPHAAVRRLPQRAAAQADTARPRGRDRQRAPAAARRQRRPAQPPRRRRGADIGARDRPARDDRDVGPQSRPAARLPRRAA